MSIARRLSDTAIPSKLIKAVTAPIPGTTDKQESSGIFVPIVPMMKKADSKLVGRQATTRRGRKPY